MQTAGPSSGAAKALALVSALAASGTQTLASAAARTAMASSSREVIAASRCNQDSIQTSIPAVQSNDFQNRDEEVQLV